jgi:hypothetical protein
VSDTQGCRVGMARHGLGTKAKPLAAYRRRLCCFEYQLRLYEIISTSGDSRNGTVDTHSSDDRFGRSRDNRRQQLPSEPSLHH